MAFHGLRESLVLHHFDPILCAILCDSERVASAGFSTQEWRLSYEIMRPNDSRKRPPHPTLLTTTNHAFGPPSLNVKSFKSGRTSNRDGSIRSTAQPSAK